MAKEIILTDNDWTMTAYMVGQRIKSERVRLKWSQTKLSKESGVSRRCISDLENGKINVGLYTIIKILGILHLTFYIGKPPQYTIDDLNRQMDDEFIDNCHSEDPNA